MKPTIEAPKLAEPGAGISKTELQLLNRVIKPLFIHNAGPGEALAVLKKTGAEVESLVQSLNEEQMKQRVLVKRLLFIEDSSRYWSAAMLCRHLAKVNTSVSRAIDMAMEATAEQLPKSSARVAAVKPELERNEISAILDFQNSIIKLTEAVENQKESDLSERSIPHPWLGKLTHVEWLWFLGIHQRIHLRQLTRILANLV